MALASGPICGGNCVCLSRAQKLKRLCRVPCAHAPLYHFTSDAREVYIFVCALFFHYVFALFFLLSHSIMLYFKTFFFAVYNIHWRLAGVLRFLFLWYHLFFFFLDFFHTHIHTKSKNYHPFSDFFQLLIAWLCATVAADAAVAMTVAFIIIMRIWWA